MDTTSFTYAGRHRILYNTASGTIDTTSFTYAGRFRILYVAGGAPPVTIHRERRFNQRLVMPGMSPGFM